MLAGLLALSLAALAGLLVRVALDGGHLGGAEGFVAVDQLQYLNWIRQAGDHLAVENLYDLAPGPRGFVHPLVIPSGLLSALGAGPAVAYLVWKPVAVVALFAGALLYARRLVPATGDRRLAVCLALFMASPVSVVGWTGVLSSERELELDFLTGELWTGTYLWGYPFTAIAVGLVPLGLLAYERGRSTGGGRWLALAAGAGLLCSWLQPWQGATLALTLVAAELVVGRGAPLAAARRLAPTLAATAAPLVYYLILSLSDASWERAGVANDVGLFSAGALVAGLAPLALPAALGARRAPADFAGTALVAWPLAALAVYLQPAGTFPAHALQGVALPLAVLGVLWLRGVLGERALPVALVAALALLLVAGTAYRADRLRGAVESGFQPYFLTGGERDALAHLRDADEEGGVLAPYYSGQLVPAHTGRETFVGARSWTPDFDERREAAERLFRGELDPAAAEAAVRASGARYLLSDCQGRAPIGADVRAFTDPPRRFGCATVYRVRPR